MALRAAFCSTGSVGEDTFAIFTQGVQRAITKQSVKFPFLRQLMAGELFVRAVVKESAAVFHVQPNLFETQVKDDARKGTPSRFSLPGWQMVMTVDAIELCRLSEMALKFNLRAHSSPREEQTTCLAALLDK